MTPIARGIASFLIVLVITVGIRTYFLSPYKIPTDTMSPTILKGDRILVNKWIYRFENPKRGDVIIFEYPLGRKKDFIKRVVGLPGERIKIEDGHVFINGTALNTPLIPIDRYYSNRDDWAYGKKGQTIEIPNDSYFVLGDNSAQSSDSRNWGFVPRRDIKAKAIFIYSPWNRRQKLAGYSDVTGKPIKNGIQKQFYPSGKLQAEWLYKNGQLEGISKEYYETGELKAETAYVNNQIDGVRKTYYKSGRVEFEHTYVNGVRDGSSKMYYETGELRGEMTMKDGVPDGEGKSYS